jgi:hypothetical protein
MVRALDGGQLLAKQKNGPVGVRGMDNRNRCPKMPPLAVQDRSDNQIPRRYMTTSIDQRIAAVESELSALGSKIGPIEAELSALPAKLRRLEDAAIAFDLRVVPLEQHKADVDTRIAALAGGLTALQIPPPPTKSFVETVNAWAEPAGKIVIPILVLVVAWFIKDSVDAALKEREIEVSTAQAMNSQLTTLRAQKGLTQPAADAAALVLSTFGRPSIMLLVCRRDI